MKSLGNKFIETRTGPNIQIADPSAANELLALALDAAQHKQRLLFFCSCQWPRCEGEIACHRTTVAELVLRAARQRGVQVEIVEWPGGEPRRIDLDVTPHRVVGPAIRQPSQWVLPVLSADFDSATSLTDYESEAIKLRRKFGLEPALI